ncbi:MAG: pilin [Opitutales bacterium]
MRRVKRGFTLVELMVVLAIVAILASIVLSAVSSTKCLAIVTGAKKLVRDCSSLITSNRGTKTQILDCLKKAQDEINKVVGNNCLDAKGKAALQVRINDINKDIDAYKKGGGSEYADELEAAKLKMP